MWRGTESALIAAAPGTKRLRTELAIKRCLQAYNTVGEQRLQAMGNLSGGRSCMTVRANIVYADSDQQRLNEVTHILTEARYRVWPCSIQEQPSSSFLQCT